MQQSFRFFIGLLVVGVTSLFLPGQLGLSEASVEENSNDDTSKVGNVKSNNTKSVAANNTIILNAGEVGKEKYRWVNSTGTENPHLNIISDTEYTVKISNPTDEEHQLIIDSESEGKTSEIAKSKEIKPESKNVEFNFKTDQVGELGYHCKYHPDQMKGTITVS
jgi:plastocyanin